MTLKPARRLGRLMRDGWLIVGITLLLFVALEAAYRAQGVVRRFLATSSQAAATDDPVPHPLADEAWWREREVGAAGWRTVYDPYRATWSALTTGPYVNIDSLGRRVTVHPRGEPATVGSRILMLGGSTMFGYTARDRFTIPSIVAGLLHEAGFPRSEVINLAQSTHNVTQGLNSLVLELRDGAVPDVAVFLDGNNEIAPAFNSGRLGGVLNQDLLARRFSAAPPSLATRLFESSQLIARLARLRRTGAATGERRARENVCPEVARLYRNTVGVGDALGDAMGFEVLFLWQPMLSTTGKPKTAWEIKIASPRGWEETVRVCTEAVESSMADLPFVSFSDVFDDRDESIFLDPFAHVTEEGNAIIAARIVELLLPLLERRGASVR